MEAPKVRQKRPTPGSARLDSIAKVVSITLEVIMGLVFVVMMVLNYFALSPADSCRPGWVKFWKASFERVKIEGDQHAWVVDLAAIYILVCILFLA
jgi:hypothetical protein